MTKPIIGQDIIQYTGLKELEPVQQEIVQIITTENFEKIKRMLKNWIQLRVLIKEYKTEGKPDKQKKYSVHLQANSATDTIDVDNAQDYDLARAMHKAFDDLKERIEHKIHLEGSKK